MACIPLLVINYSITEIFAKHSSNECHYGNLKSFISIQKKHFGTFYVEFWDSTSCSVVFDVKMIKPFFQKDSML
jgi:hypothetical protein